MSFYIDALHYSTHVAHSSPHNVAVEHAYAASGVALVICTQRHFSALSPQYLRRALVRKRTFELLKRSGTYTFSYRLAVTGDELSNDDIAQMCMSMAYLKSVILVGVGRVTNDIVPMLCQLPFLHTFEFKGHGPPPGFDYRGWLALAKDHSVERVRFGALFMVSKIAGKSPAARQQVVEAGVMDVCLQLLQLRNVNDPRVWGTALETISEVSRDQNPSVTSDFLKRVIREHSEWTLSQRDCSFLTMASIRLLIRQCERPDMCEFLIQDKVMDLLLDLFEAGAAKGEPQRAGVTVLLFDFFIRLLDACRKDKSGDPSNQFGTPSSGRDLASKVTPLVPKLLSIGARFAERYPPSVVCGIKLGDSDGDSDDEDGGGRPGGGNGDDDDDDANVPVNRGGGGNASNNSSQNASPRLLAAVAAAAGNSSLTQQQLLQQLQQRQPATSNQKQHRRHRKYHHRPRREPKNLLGDVYVLVRLIVYLQLFHGAVRESGILRYAVRDFGSMILPPKTRSRAADAIVIFGGPKFIPLAEIAEWPDLQNDSELTDGAIHGWATLRGRSLVSLPLPNDTTTTTTTTPSSSLPTKRCMFFFRPASYLEDACRDTPVPEGMPFSQALANFYHTASIITETNSHISEVDKALYLTPGVTSQQQARDERADLLTAKKMFLESSHTLTSHLAMPLMEIENAMHAHGLIAAAGTAAAAAAAADGGSSAVKNLVVTEALVTSQFMTEDVEKLEPNTLNIALAREVFRSPLFGRRVPDAVSAKVGSLLQLLIDHPQASLQELGRLAMHGRFKENK